MTDPVLAGLGVVVLLGGIAILALNARLTAYVRPRVLGRNRFWDRALRTGLYQPDSRGRLPVLTIVGLGWVAFGTVFAGLGLGVLR